MTERTPIKPPPPLDRDELMRVRVPADLALRAAAVASHMVGSVSPSAGIALVLREVLPELERRAGPLKRRVDIDMDGRTDLMADMPLPAPEGEGE